MRGGSRLGAGRPRKPKWLADISADRADRQAPALTEAEKTRLVDLKTAYDFVVATLVRLRAIPVPTVPVLRAIRAEHAMLLQLDLALSKAEARQPPAVDPPVVSKWAGVLS
jgi:hypothetical protein